MIPYPKQRLPKPPPPPASVGPSGAGTSLLQAEELPENTVVLGRSSGRAELDPPALGRLLLTVSGFLFAVAASYLLPVLHDLRPWVPGEGYIPFWNVVGRELLGEGAQVEQQLAEMEALVGRVQGARGGGAPQPRPQATLQPIGASSAAPASTGTAVQVQQPVFPEYEDQMDDNFVPKVAIEAPKHLERYFRQLTRVELKVEGAIARAAHWGDSILANDGVTSAIRRRLQRRFGDGGHGFHVLARYNQGYHHHGVGFKGRGSWRKCEIIFKCEKDAHYGFGGVSARSSGGGTGAWWTTKEGLGSKVSMFELWYAEMPKGGKFQIKVDGKVDRVVDTWAEELGDAWERIEVEPGKHTFEVRAIGDGVARGYGVVLETAGPGAVWDGLSLIGSFTQRLDYQEPAHIARQIAHRKTDLVVFLLGGNDVQRQGMDLVRTMKPYEEEFTRVVTKYSAAPPGGGEAPSCLVMSVTDHGERVSRGIIKTRKLVPRLVASQRKVALENGCAFYDTFSAMGGPGAMARWYRARPPLGGPDLAHPTSDGHDLLGGLMYGALMHSYAAFRRDKAGEPFPELKPSP